MIDGAYDPRVRGRNQVQIERDVLVAMVSIEPFRGDACGLLQSSDFTTSAHREIFLRIASMPFSEMDERITAIAHAIDTTIDTAERWMMAASPVTYAADMQLLIERR